VQIHVHQPYRIAPIGEGDRQIDGNGALAHASLSAHDQKCMFDLGQLLGDTLILLLPLFLFVAVANVCLLYASLDPFAII
jgi:hypothetical protein